MARRLVGRLPILPVRAQTPPPHPGAALVPRLKGRHLILPASQAVVSVLLHKDRPLTHLVPVQTRPVARLALLPKDQPHILLVLALAVRPQAGLLARLPKDPPRTHLVLASPAALYAPRLGVPPLILRVRAQVAPRLLAGPLAPLLKDLPLIPLVLDQTARRQVVQSAPRLEGLRLILLASQAVVLAPHPEDRHLILRVRAQTPVPRPVAL